MHSLISQKYLIKLRFIIANVYTTEAERERGGLCVVVIQRHKVELNIILPRVNNFDIKQKKAWDICFIIYHQYQTRSGKMKANKKHQISVTAQVFFAKAELQHI